MKLSTVQEALASEIDEPVLAIRGTLTKLFNPMTGEGQYGEWSLQNGELKDATGSIKVVFDGREQVPGDYRGKVIELRCTKSQKGGWTGVKRIVDKKDKKTPKLSISSKGEVILFNEEHEPEPDGQAKGPASRAQGPPETSQPQPKANASASATTPAKSPPPDEAANLAEGMARIYEIMNTQLAAITLVHKYLVPAVKLRTGLTIDAQQEAALVQNCLIQMYYEKSHHFFRRKPYRLDDNGTPPPSPDTPPPDTGG